MVSAKELWEKAKPLVRQRMRFTPDAWRSVEAAVPVAVDGTTFVLGLATENERLRAHLETTTMLALIREILRELTGIAMDVVIITGTTEEDWQHYKRRQSQLRQLIGRGEGGARKPQESDWAALVHQMDHAYAHLLHRQYDFVKAKFLLDWADKIAEFATNYLAQHPDKSEEVTRELERICQRLAGTFNTSAVVIGLEIERALRARRAREA